MGNADQIIVQTLQEILEEFKDSELPITYLKMDVEGKNYICLITGLRQVF